jgi:hypothetical protein
MLIQYTGLYDSECKVRSHISGIETRDKFDINCKPSEPSPLSLTTSNRYGRQHHPRHRDEELHNRLPLRPLSL